jgi:hypothetical protein
MTVLLGLGEFSYMFFVLTLAPAASDRDREST